MSTRYADTQPDRSFPRRNSQQPAARTHNADRDTLPFTLRSSAPDRSKIKEVPIYINEGTPDTPRFTKHHVPQLETFRDKEYVFYHVTDYISWCDRKRIHDGYRFELYLSTLTNEPYERFRTIWDEFQEEYEDDEITDEHFLEQIRIFMRNVNTNPETYVFLNRYMTSIRKPDDMRVQQFFERIKQLFRYLQIVEHYPDVERSDKKLHQLIYQAMPGSWRLHARTSGNTKQKLDNMTLAEMQGLFEGLEAYTDELKPKTRRLSTPTFRGNRGRRTLPSFSAAGLMRRPIIQSNPYNNRNNGPNFRNTGFRSNFSNNRGGFRGGFRGGRGGRGGRGSHNTRPGRFQSHSNGQPSQPQRSHYTFTHVPETGPTGGEAGTQHSHEPEQTYPSATLDAHEQFHMNEQQHYAMEAHDGYQHYATESHDECAEGYTTEYAYDGEQFPEHYHVDTQYIEPELYYGYNHGHPTEDEVYDTSDQWDEFE